MPMPLPDPPRLHLNEHISPRVAVQLRRHGFDVTSTHERGWFSLSDEDQLEQAAAERRAVVTFNVVDFSLLHNAYLETGRHHWGLVFSTETPVGVMLHRLLRLLNSITAADLKSQVCWLNEFK